MFCVEFLGKNEERAVLVADRALDDRRLRPDDVTKQNNRDRFQSIAPEAENGFYLVPKVIE